MGHKCHFPGCDYGKDNPNNSKANSTANETSMRKMRPDCYQEVKQILERWNNRDWKAPANFYFCDTHFKSEAYDSSKGAGYIRIDVKMHTLIEWPNNPAIFTTTTSVSLEDSKPPERKPPKPKKTTSSSLEDSKPPERKPPKPKKTTSSSLEGNVLSHQKPASSEYITSIFPALALTAASQQATEPEKGNRDSMTRPALIRYANRLDENDSKNTSQYKPIDNINTTASTSQSSSLDCSKFETSLNSGGNNILMSTVLANNESVATFDPPDDTMKSMNKSARRTMPQMLADQNSYFKVGDSTTLGSIEVDLAGPNHEQVATDGSKGKKPLKRRTSWRLLNSNKDSKTDAKPIPKH